MSDIPSLTGAQAPAPTSGISNDTSRLTSHANLKKAGEKFEAVFVNMMLKSMRKTKLAGDDSGLFDQKNMETFRDMQDQKVSESMAAHQPIGIGKAMVEFLARSQAAVQPGAGDTTGDAP